MRLYAAPRRNSALAIFAVASWGIFGSVETAQRHEVIAWPLELDRPIRGRVAIGLPPVKKAPETVNEALAAGCWSRTAIGTTLRRILGIPSRRRILGISGRGHILGISGRRQAARAVQRRIVALLDG